MSFGNLAEDQLYFSFALQAKLGFCFKEFILGIDGTSDSKAMTDIIGISLGVGTRVYPWLSTLPFTDPGESLSFPELGLF